MVQKLSDIETYKEVATGLSTMPKMESHLTCPGDWGNFFRDVQTHLCLGCRLDSRDLSAPSQRTSIQKYLQATRFLSSEESFNRAGQPLLRNRSRQLRSQRVVEDSLLRAR